MIEDTSRANLQRFGLTAGSGLAILGLIGWARSHVGMAVGLWAVGGLLLFLGLTVPRLLRPVQSVWMTLAMALGWVNTRIILTILFYGIFTPLGLVRRWFTRDPLDPKLRDGRASYWVRKAPRSFDPKAYEKQF